MASKNAMWSSRRGSFRSMNSNNGNNNYFQEHEGFSKTDYDDGARGFGHRYRGIKGGNSAGHFGGSWVEDRHGKSTGSSNDVSVGKIAIDLTLSDDDQAGDNSLRVNKNYANRYDRWRRVEETEKTKSRHGNDEELDEDSSSSEDEYGNRLPPEFDKEFLRALSCLKGKDPRIYDGRSQFFENLDITNLKDAHSSKRKSERPLFLKDYERQMLLTNEEGLPDEEKDNEKLKEELLVGNGTYVEEQLRIKQSFKQAVVNSDEDEDDDLLTKRKKTVDEVVEEDDDYYTWLKGQKQHLQEKDVEKDIGHLKNMWNNKSLPADEEFLRDFIVDKKYLNRKTGAFATGDTGFALNSLEDETFAEETEKFETKFNFRYEEPDQEFIKRYPRLVTTSLRVKDEKRKEQRNKTRERKLKKKDQKREELKRLKAMKRKEIVEKLEKIQQITGNANVGLETADLEGDFDPEAYDRRMKQLFDEEYYDCHAEEKPEFPPDDEDYENWDEWEGNNKTEAAVNHEPHCEDPDFNMDCEYNPKADFQEEMMNASRKKRRKLSKLAKALQRKKPVFDPKDKTFEEYFDEYYKLDYEDIIDDLPCRFKYRKVQENDFGLTIEEILSAEDRELNTWCSLKKTCQYRSEQEEMRDLDAYRQKSRSFWKKEKILKSIYAKDVEEEVAKDVVETKTKKKKAAAPKDRTETENPSKRFNKNPKSYKEQGKHSKHERGSKRERDTEKGTRKSGKFGERSGNKYKGVDVGISDSRLKAFGLNPKKFKDKLIYGNKTG